MVQLPEFALKYTLLSAAGIVINEKLEFVGGVNEKELRKKYLFILKDFNY